MKKLNKNQKQKLKDNIFKVLHILGYISMGLLIVIFIIVGVNGCSPKSNIKEVNVNQKNQERSININTNYSYEHLYNINESGYVEVHDGDVYLLPYSSWWFGNNSVWYVNDTYDVRFQDTCYITYYTFEVTYNEVNGEDVPSWSFDDAISISVDYIDVNDLRFDFYSYNGGSYNLVDSLDFSSEDGEYSYLLQFGEDTQAWSMPDVNDEDNISFADSYRFFNGYIQYVDTDILDYQTLRSVERYLGYQDFVIENFIFPEYTYNSYDNRMYSYNIYTFPLSFDYDTFLNAYGNGYKYFPFASCSYQSGSNSFGGVTYHDNFAYVPLNPYLNTEISYEGLMNLSGVGGLGNVKSYYASSKDHDREELSLLPFPVGNGYEGQYLLGHPYYLGENNPSDYSMSSHFFNYAGCYNFHNVYVNFLSYCFNVSNSRFLGFNQYHSAFFDTNISFKLNEFTRYQTYEREDELLIGNKQDIPNGNVGSGSYNYFNAFNGGVYYYKGTNYNNIRISYNLIGLANPWSTIYQNQSTSYIYSERKDSIVDITCYSTSIYELQVNILNGYNPNVFTFLKSKSVRNPSMVASSGNGVINPTDNGALGGVFTLFGDAFSSIASILNVSVFGAFTIGSILFLPLVVTIVLFIVKMFKR